MSLNPLRTVTPLVLGLGLMGCNPQPEPEPPALEASLRRMTDCADLESYVTEAVVDAIVDGRYGMYRFGIDVEAPEAVNDNASGDDGPTDYSTTNVQEAGVDELDIVKTNGTHLFVASDRALQILSSWPVEEAELLSTTTFDGWLQGLFLLEGRAVVFEGGWDPTTYRNHTTMHVLDVADPAAPTILRSVRYDGWVADARLIDDDVYAVLNQWMDIPTEVWELGWSDDVELPEIDWDLPEDERDAQLEAARIEARATLTPLVAAQIQALGAASFLPTWDDGLGAGSQQLLSCDDVYAPSASSRLSMLSVVQLDAQDGSTGSTGILGDGWNVYASRDNLYVAQTSWWWWGFEDAGVSHIHQFALDADAEPSYAGSGEVRGWLYDQFAMSEYDGHLRVVSTDFRGWWGTPADDQDDPPANHVTVLQNQAGALVEVGHVGGIAPNEQIMAARLMGEKGYMVTFETTDPLFTLDLSDPTDPRIIGELHMPGYSAYLHPIGDDHLLAVGMDGLEDGTLTGVAVTLFDVSDFANPVISDQLALNPPQGGGWSWSWSEAMWDHHAFTYHRDTLTIPAFFHHYDPSDGSWEGFSGAVSMFATAEDGITELGRVDHADLVSQSECIYDMWYDWGGSACSWDGGYWYAQVRRSVVIEDNLFTISDYGVKVTDLADPEVLLASVVYYPVSDASEELVD